MKKVLLIVIDALASRVMRPAMEQGQLPNFARLAELGHFNGACTSIFPSITPAATSSIATGCYPAEHKISGAHFYDYDADRLHYYGADFWLVLNQGFDRFVKDFLIQLNHKQLARETLFQHVERVGRRAACLNYLIFRGDQEHRADVPTLLSLWPGVPPQFPIMGPKVLCLGDFISTRPDGDDEEFTAQGGLFNRYGFVDDATAALLGQLASHGTLPDFTLAYFPDNDFRSHEVGPVSAMDTLENIDRKLGEFIEHWGGHEQMLEELSVIVTGDHSQTEVKPRGDRPSIDLDELFADFSHVNAGSSWNGDDQIMPCPNLRAAQVYLHRGARAGRDRVIEAALADDRIDQAMWKEALSADGARYHVVTTGGRELVFWPERPSEALALDHYEAGWSWEGDLGVVDGRVTSSGILETPEYPNALERIAMSFNGGVSGDLWLTARPGYDFVMPRVESHPGGGSHGSLHALDSTVPLLAAGVPEEIAMPAHPRTVDVAPLCLSILGITPPRRAGASHLPAFVQASAE